MFVEVHEPQYNNEELQQMEENRRQRDCDLPRQAEEAEPDCEQRERADTDVGTLLAECLCCCEGKLLMFPFDKLDVSADECGKKSLISQS